MSKKKTIVCELTVETSVDNFEICSCIERILQGSLLGSSEYKLEILQTKVTKDED